MHKHLTMMELAVVRLRAEGMTNRQAAQRLGIAESTAKGHTSLAYAALGAKNIVQAMTALGWVKLPGYDV